MEQQIDRRLIRAERQKRAWSQEHLANVTGLGLRTIQRIEASGKASNESAAALAAVFSLPLSSLRAAGPEQARRVKPWLSHFATTAAFAAGFGAIFSLSFALADDVDLDLGVEFFEQGETEPSQIAMTKSLVSEGGNAEIAIDGIARFVVTPTVREDGRVLLSVEVFEFDGADYVKIREPRVLTEHGRPAEIFFGAESGNVYRVSLTPDQPAGADD